MSEIHTQVTSEVFDELYPLIVQFFPKFHMAINTCCNDKISSKIDCNYDWYKGSMVKNKETWWRSHV